MEVSKNIEINQVDEDIITGFSKFCLFINSVGLFLLILLWSYAVFAKLADLSLYRQQMQQQSFSSAGISLLTYALPCLEAIVAFLLIVNQNKWGLWISLLLLLSFTFYIILILGHFFPETPCSCGGFISKMSWKKHLWFNLGLISANIFCLCYFINRERRLSGAVSKINIEPINKG